MKLTIEQTSIINAVKQGFNIQVQALAGTGKSTTLREIAKAIPEKNFLVLCFNAANALESNKHKDKPSNVVYSTVHSLAYNEIVIKNKLKNSLQNYLDYNDISGLDVLASSLAVTSKQAAAELSILRKAVVHTIQDFCKSDSRMLHDFCTESLTAYFEYDYDKYERVLKKLVHITHEYGIKVFSDEAKINHDVYVKLYQLGSKQISTVTDKISKKSMTIDVCMLDEAQDSNAVTLAILKQQQMQTIVVGDDNQALYAWRGATGVANKFINYSQLELTNSFRFGSVIADMANVILASKTDLTVKGLGTAKDIVTKAHLCRTNASVIEAGIGYMNTGARIFVNIDINDLFSKLYHIQACYFNEKPKYPNKELVNIVDKATLKELMAINKDIAQLSNLQRLMSTTFGNLTQAKSKFTALCTTADKADITISTIHRSKGLEWDSVVIDEDFVQFREDEDTDECPIEAMWQDVEKTNMLYVAITRAKVECALPSYLTSYFDM